jgi:prophage antirepressor-like protein
MDLSKRKYGEALTNCNSQGLLSNKSSEGIIDMNIVAKSDLNFQGKALVPVSNITGTWLTSSDLAKALQYSNSRAVTMIYNKYADEFTSAMTQVLEVSTSGDEVGVLNLSTSKNVRNLKKKVRVFSLRGAHLIAMFARTPVAKEFRRWVLDILDREVAQGNVNPAFDFKMHVHNINVACIHLDAMYEIWRNELSPALRTLGSPVAGKMVDRLKDACAQVNGVRGGMERASGLKGLQYH